MQTEISRRNLLLSGAFATVAAALSGCSSGSSSSGPRLGGAPASQKASIKDLVYAQSVQITSLATAGNQPEVYPAGYEAAFAIYSGLVRFTQDLKFEPDLATEWSTSKDGLTWTFKLRQGVIFHDGAPFNADAVVAYFSKMTDSSYNVAAYSLWEPIKKTTKIADNTISIETKKPYGALLNTLAHGSGLVPSPALTKAGPDKAALHPVGTGPYRVKSFQPGSKLVVSANPHYYGDSPVYDSITYTYVGDSAGRVAAVQSGQANIIDAVPVQQAKQLSTGPTHVLRTTSLQTYGIGMNQTNPILRDVKVRKALNLAIDVDAIVQALFRGYAKPLDSPLAPDTRGHETVGSNTYDPTKAKSLLADAGLTPGPNGKLTKDGRPITLRLRTPDGLYTNDTLVAQTVQQQLAKVGIDATIQKVDKSSFWDSIKVAKADVDFDLVLFGFNPSHGSGALQLDIMYRSNSSDGPVQGWNFNWYSNPKVDALLTTALHTVDSGKQQQVLAKAEQLIWNDAPYIWLYVPDILTAYDSKAATPLVLPVLFTLPSRAATG